MKLSTPKKWIWIISLVGAYALLFLSLLLPILLAVLKPSCCPIIRDFYNDWNNKITGELNTALANAARILGTGAALTLLATAADRDIQDITASDILREQYPFLISSYCVFFILVFTSSIAGDCNQGAIALFSCIGACLLVVWFFWLALILLLDSNRQRNMLFGYYSQGVSNDQLSLNERMSFLQKAVRLARSNLACSKELSDVIRTAVCPYAQLDEESELAVYNDQWEQVRILEGAEIAEAAWTQLQSPNDEKNSLSPLQINTLCADVLITDSRKGPETIQSILLISFVDALLPKGQGDSYTAACQKLTTFCRTLRAKHQGAMRSEQLIGYLACAFGMALTIASVNRAAPDWVHPTDLASAWRLFSNNFHSAVFFCIDQSDNQMKTELEQILQYMEWSTRKKLDYSWTAYDHDRLYIVDADARSCLEQAMTNLYLLDYMFSQYSAQYIVY